MSREEKIRRLIQAIEKKRGELGLTEEDAKQYDWLVQLLRQKSADKSNEQPPEPKPTGVKRKKFDGYA